MGAHESHYTALGRMLVAFQSMEATLTQGLILLLNNEVGTPNGQLAYATVSELSFASASRLASILPSIFTSERIGSSSPEGAARLSEELDDCANYLTQGLKLANDAEQRRNQLVHSHWLTGPGIVNPHGTLTRMKTKVKARNLSIQFERETIADIDKNTESVEEAQRLIGHALRNYRLVSKHGW